MRTVYTVLASVNCFSRMQDWRSSSFSEPERWRSRWIESLFRRWAGSLWPGPEGECVGGLGFVGFVGWAEGVEAAEL